MKFKSTFLTVFFFVGTAIFIQAFSQNLFEGYSRELTPDEHLLIQEEICEYEVFDFPFAELNFQLKDTGEDSVSTVQFKISELYDWQMTLKENEIRATNYLLVETTDEEVFVRHKEKNVNTYKGFINGDTSQWVRLFVSDNKMGGLISYEGTLLNIEPVMEYISDSLYRHSFILFEQKEKKCLEEFDCLFDDSIVDLGEIPVTPRDDKERFLEFATDADFEFFLKHMNDDPNNPPIINVENAIVAKINNVDGIYQSTFGMSIQLVYQHIWSTSNDPYSGDIQNHWQELKDHWETEKTCVQKDAVTLFSGKNLNALGYVHWTGYKSICGFLQPPSCPGPQAYYAVVEDVDWTTVAHELAHNIGIGHFCECKIMQSAVSCNNPCPSEQPVFSSDAQNAINAVLQGAKLTCDENDELDLLANDRCLEHPAPIDYDFNILVEPDQAILGDLPLCGDEFTFTFYNTFDPPDIEWELGPNLSLTNGTLTSQTISVEASDEGCTYVSVTFPYHCGEAVTLKREFNVGKPEMPGMPFVYENPPGSGLFSVGIQAVKGADFYMITWQICSPPGPCFGGGMPPYQINNHDPILNGIGSGYFLHLEVAAGNECGISDFRIFEWVDPDYLGLLIGDNQINPLPNTLQHPLEFANAHPEGENTKVVSSLGLSQQKLVSLEKGREKTTIYPNPASDNFYIHLAKSGVPCQIQIYDPVGQLVQQRKSKPDVEKVEINTAGWEDGVYLIKIQSQNKHEILKVVLQKQ